VHGCGLDHTVLMRHVAHFEGPVFASFFMCGFDLL
jgi:hypothetical protein